MTPLNQQLEDKKKELLRLDKYIHKYRKAHCPICKEKMSCFEDIEKHKKLTKHFGDYAEDLNLNERKMFQLEEYNIRQAEIAILEQAIAEIKNIIISNHSESKNVIGEPHLNCPDCVNPLVTDKSSVVSNLLQKQRQEILDKIDKWALNVGYQENTDEFFKDVERLKQQLNQPKTEE